MSDPRWILFIDGNDNERGYYADRLRRSGSDYEIFEAANGRAGLELCKSHPIDCVILEIDLPDMSGFEVLLKLVPVSRHPQTAVVVLTRQPSSDLLYLAKTNGAQAALAKFGTSGDVLDRTVLKAMATVQADRKRRME
jgi:DNA-binding NarL/FixJ family response regulator